ncbi:hypothetical protein N7512_007521 [Penicillium capsulatum]|nr:hypothetical protein N7512_007521 [Penicillium capsulatum]
MGLLASDEVIEVSATELVGQYVGQTGPKTQKLLERGLGKVLFIDEAYRVAEGHFAKEAIDELVECITKLRFARKLIIILAGYDADMNHLMSVNPGLTSRFPESLQFESLSPRDCIHLLGKLLERKKKDIFGKSGVNFDITCLHCSDSDLNRSLTDGFDILSKTTSWANARDVETLVGAIFRKTMKELGVSSDSTLVLSKEAVIEELQGMVNERRCRENFQTKRPPLGLNPGENIPLHTQSSCPPAKNMENQNLRSNTIPGVRADAPHEDRSNQHSPVPGRDAGVTNEVWNLLQKQKTAGKKEKDYLVAIEKGEELEKELRRLKNEEDKAARAAEEAERQQKEQLRKRFEKERLQLERQRRMEEAIAKELEIKRQFLAEARRKEQAIQVKLRSMGVCIQGYQWVRHSGGYRCEGGSHWVAEAQLQ